MSDGIKDVLALADAISARKATDERFADLLTEISTALADITEAMTKPEKSEARDEAKEAELMGKALAAALLAGIKAMPQPVIKVEVPAQGAAQPSWKTIEIDLNRDASGRIGDKLRLTRT